MVEEGVGQRRSYRKSTERLEMLNDSNGLNKLNCPKHLSPYCEEGYVPTASFRCEKGMKATRDASVSFLSHAFLIMDVDSEETAI